MLPDINRTDMENAESSSGYSSMLTSPQSSDEDSLLKTIRSKTQLELRSPLSSNRHVDYLETDEEVEIQEDEEEECEFRPVHDPNELEPHKEWYQKLLMFGVEFKQGLRGPFPPFPPPPLPSAMIAASRAISYNAFEAVKKAATSLSARSPNTTSLENRAQRFSPSDFQPLPPPHVYLQMIRTLAPHQYIDLTYALAGSVLLEMGVKVPEAYPPLPPKIEPFRDLEAEERAHLTEMSSQSSSEGEYSDASEHSRFLDKLKRRKNRERRAAREIRIAAKQLHEPSICVNDAEEMKKETFSRESVYKEGLPFPSPPFIPPPPVLIPIPYPVDVPFDPPIMCVPISMYLLSPPETPSSSTLSLHNNNQLSEIEKLQDNVSLLELRKKD
ncbi:Protein CBG01512 [Caenorhabditis briggsae]|uniref:Protein CBG01512 n=1 Tax=Caenorhabditis briggsae TaxID=6238 RepID=A8WQI6_CAEBR|nr:Protein CBG01512 [Caenorhabditis briggsae]CAP22744.2 Protein CBG01512 [Caenorhabditis briggsae]